MTRLKIAKLCFYIVAIGLFGTGLIYMFLGTPMPYHLDAMQVAWSDLPQQYQVIITAFQRGAASGFLGGGIAIAMMTFFALERGGSWVRWGILLMGLIETIPAIHSVSQVMKHTPGEPPLGALVIFTILTLAGFFLSKSKNEPA
ncbi:hypothetical protein RHODOSMS8_02435 [Rhodobiaceae bacterium]|nr:hypothetical protein RHODOSMS8_02435 [Rhodobiaceae bacterium]